ncbi:MAG: GNAT family N-acetyltransferase [Firmicutes bacterium]|nr:GNAT family N-acetyltransferase [Bacillota bacterium]
MSCCIPQETCVKILKYAEQCLQVKLQLKKSLLFPKSVYITDVNYEDDHPEKFLLIFNIKVDHLGKKTGCIRYFQIPLHMRHHGLAKKIYFILENELQDLGCQIINVEATIDNSSHTTVKFWEHLGFKISPYCSFENDTCPMYKQFKGIE